MSPIQQMFLGLGAASDSYWWVLFGDMDNNQEKFNDMHLDSSDNIYATGFTTNGPNGGNDGIATKWDKDGALQWQRAHGAGSDNDKWFGSSVDSSGNLWCYGQDTTNYRMTYGKLTTSNQSWSLSKRYNYSSSRAGQGCNGVGGYASYGFACGSTTSLNKQGWVWGHNSSGNNSGGSKLTAGDNTDGSGTARQVAPACICAAKSGGDIHAAGYIEDLTCNSQSRNVGFIVKLNDYAGALTWQRFIGTNYTNIGGIDTDSSDNVYVAGQDNDGTGTKAFVAKYNSSGTIQWQRRLGTPCDGGTYAIAVDDDGNSYSCGKVATGQHGWIAKLDTSGSTSWCRTFKTSVTADEEELQQIRLDSGGNLVICGHHRDDAESSDIALLMRLPSDGSFTGTYGIFTFTAATPTNADASMTTSSDSHITRATNQVDPVSFTIDQDTPTFETTLQEI